MKANEAPEKIYFGTQQNTTNPFSGLTQKCANDDIEYVRKDAFIEKTCEFIKERFSFEDSWHVEGETSILDKVIEDFKKYMKGE